MDFPRSRERSAKRKHPLGLVTAVVAVCSVALLAAPALGHQTTTRKASVRAHSTASASSSGQGAGSGLADLPAVPAKMSCADLAQTTKVAGQTIDITAEQTTSATPTSPVYWSPARDAPVDDDSY